MLLLSSGSLPSRFDDPGQPKSFRIVHEVEIGRLLDNTSDDEWVVGIIISGIVIVMIR